MSRDEEKAIRLDERERVFAEIRTALSCVTGFRPAALKVEEWKAISDGFPENATATPTPEPTGDDLREARRWVHSPENPSPVSCPSAPDGPGHWMSCDRLAVIRLRETLAARSATPPGKTTP